MRVFGKGQIKYLFPSRVLHVFALARADEALKEADLSWTAWLHQEPHVETQADEADPYEMLVQVPLN